MRWSPKIDTFLNDLMRSQFPGDVAIKEASKSWSNDAMRFSFKAKKGFLGATISGVIRVNQDAVVMDSDLPGLVTAFVSEDQIRNVINEQLDGLFPLKPRPTLRHSIRNSLAVISQEVSKPPCRLVV